MPSIITVIIATLNAEQTVSGCLDSIVIQKNNNIEVIVVDGGSIDATLAILSRYESHIDILISEQDSGIYDAWNKGIIKSHGEWIMFLGADDTLEADAFAKYLSFLENHDTNDIDFICAKNTYVGVNGAPLEVIGVPWRWNQFRINMKTAHVASLHRRSLFDAVGLYDLKFRICGDYELLLRKKNLLRTLYVDTCIARMAIGGASYSTKALMEAHTARKMHSGLPAVFLWTNFVKNYMLFQRHRLFNSLIRIA